MSFRVDKDIMVPMRDGVLLATDVWVPAGGDPAPVLLVRLPYGKDMIALYAYGAGPERLRADRSRVCRCFPGLPGHIQVRRGVQPHGQRAQRRR